MQGLGNPMDLTSSNKKIMFLGYGAVGKCSWTYFQYYFKVNLDQVYLVDKTKTAFYGSKVLDMPQDHLIEKELTAYNFGKFIKDLGFNVGDIVIDLTFSTDTYYFIKVCLEEGYFYLNTSIEDGNDDFLGRSIDCQQQTIDRILVDFLASSKSGLRSSILTECGQNPGLIQHYVLHALNKMNQLHQNTKNAVDDYSKETLLKVIDTFHVGSILMSEIDGLKTTRPLKKNVLYNTWSVSGFCAEALEMTELVRGTQNKYIQPTIPNELKHKAMTELYKGFQRPGTEVLFLKEPGINAFLPTICPMVKDGVTKFTNMQGRLIHHGEIFELAQYFGANAPFMTYVYQNSPYMDQSLTSFMKNNPCEETELQMYISDDPKSFNVFDNWLVPQSQHMKGYDSIGCTLFCGKRKVDRIFWCGSVLRDTHPCVLNEFTPTTVQVAAGVLSGLSYMLEPTTQPAYLQPTNIPTDYMLKKATPLLGEFGFAEIPVSMYKGDINNIIIKPFMRCKSNPKRCRTRSNKKNRRSAHK